MVEFELEKQLHSTDSPAKLKKSDEKYYIHLIAEEVRAIEEGTLKFETFIHGLSTLFQTLPINELHDLIDAIVLHSEIFKNPINFKAFRNLYLRIFNDLLKRVSSILHSTLSGKIRIFLANIMPFDEKSGVNLMGHCNIAQNVDNSDDDDLKNYDFSEALKTMEIPNIMQFDDHSMFENYRDLHNILRNPFILFVDVKQFQIFKSHVEYFIKTIRACYRKANSDISLLPLLFSSISDNKTLFVNEFENPLVHCTLLIEILIVFRFLASPNDKFKRRKITVMQKEWMNSNETQIFSILNFHNPQFSNIFEDISMSEARWSSWKNNGCPEIEVACPKTNDEPFEWFDSTELPKFGEYSTKDCYDTEWFTHNIEINNNTKTAVEFFSEAVLQLDPNEDVDQEYRLFNATNQSGEQLEFQWKSHRLLYNRCQDSIQQSMVSTRNHSKLIKPDSNQTFGYYRLMRILEALNPEWSQIHVEVENFNKAMAEGANKKQLVRDRAELGVLIQNKLFINNLVKLFGSIEPKQLISDLELDLKDFDEEQLNASDDNKDKLLDIKNNITSQFLSKFDSSATVSDLISKLGFLDQKTITNALSL
ncbi:MAG: THO complex subunit 1 [Marteilia pararefringens]